MPDSLLETSRAGRTSRTKSAELFTVDGIPSRNVAKPLKFAPQDKVPRGLFRFRAKPSTAWLRTKSPPALMECLPFDHVTVSPNVASFWSIGRSVLRPPFGIPENG